MSKRPKILRIINRFNLGGPTYNAAYLTKYLEDDFETRLIGGEKMASEESSLHITSDLGLRTTVIKDMTRSIGLMSEWKAYKNIRTIIRDFKPDIVHTHASKAGLLGRMAASAEKVPHLVHTFHGNVFEGYFPPTISNSIMVLERRLAKKCGRIIAISELQKQDLVSKYRIAPSEKIEVVKLGFDLERFMKNQEQKRQQFRQAWKIGEHEITVGIVGRLVPIKDHRLFLKIVARLKNQGLQFRALIIGDGELASSLKSYAADLGLMSGDDVLFTSWQKEMDVVMAGLDVVAMTSLNEGTPVSLIEAQAAGRPVISTDVGGVRDIVPEVSWPYILSGRSESDFAAALEKLISEGELRRELSLEGRKFVLKQHGVERLAEEMKAVYHSLLNGPKIEGV